MAKATGLSEGYCSFVPCSLEVPHPRHWQAFAVLGVATTDQGVPL